MTAPPTRQRRCFASMVIPDDLHHYFDPQFERSLITDAENEATGDTQRQLEDFAVFEAELQEMDAYFSASYQWHVKMCLCNRP